jgi:hypothetical protein
MMETLTPALSRKQEGERLAPLPLGEGWGAKSGFEKALEGGFLTDSSRQGRLGRGRAARYRSPPS